MLLNAQEGWDEGGGMQAQWGEEIHMYVVLCVVTQSCLFPTPWTVAHQAPLSLGLLQARILERVAMSSSRASSRPRDQTQVSHIVGRFYTI